jgi:molybdate transport system permease protein
VYKRQVVASVVFNIPFMVQPIQRAFEAVPRDLTEAAAVSGLSFWQTLWRVELPLAWPGVLSASVLTIVHTLGEFGVVLMMGGSIPGETRTVAIAIYDRVQAFDLAGADRMALLLTAASLLAVAASFFASARLTVRR